MTHDEVLRAIIRESMAARSALCENELVIRLDNILALAQEALDESARPPAESPDGAVPPVPAAQKNAAKPLA